MAEFKSFRALASNWKQYDPEKVSKYALPRIGSMLQTYIKNQHGKTPPRNAKSTILRKGFDKPLIETGALREAVEYLKNDNDHSVKVFTTMPFIAGIQEYGAVIQMSEKQKRWFAIFMSMLNKNKKKKEDTPKGSGVIVIPPRMIWRKVITNKEKTVIEIVHSCITKFLTND